MDMQGLLTPSKVFLDFSKLRSYSQLNFLECRQSATVLRLRNGTSGPMLDDIHPFSDIKHRNIAFHGLGGAWQTRSRKLCRCQAVERPCHLFLSGFALEGIGLYVERLVHFERLKTIIHVIRCSGIRKSRPRTPYLRGLLQSGPFICGVERASCTARFITRLIVHVLFALVVAISVMMQPYKQLSASAFAAISPPDVDSTGEDTQDFYDILFKKIEEKDAELGRSRKQDGLEQKVREFHMKVKKQKERTEAVRKAFEELRQSRSHVTRSNTSEKDRIGPLLGRIFHQFKSTWKEKAQYEVDSSPLEEDLKKLFDAKIFELQKTSELEDKAMLEKKVREFLCAIQTIKRSWVAEAQRGSGETWKQLEVNEYKLKCKLAGLIQRYCTLYKHLKVSGGGVVVLDKQLLELESEIGSVWENLLYHRVSLWKDKSGDLYSSSIEFSPVEMEIREGKAGDIQGEGFASPAEDFQQIDAHSELVKDLTKFLDHIFEHNISLEEPFVEAANKASSKFLNSLKDEEKSKQLFEIINNVIREERKVVKGNECD
ncbi:hypothetical protein KP509_05G031500 [Ceratopteris richardii]|uniref:Uncharacterized protein n=1 Tax=Ceratopteris richardii TaxID=49495 RepID=A0A8T2USC9_CERRI|nr:hypothetical protein KP509_05G031500 [Ceratopteris richardii]